MEGDKVGIIDADLLSHGTRHPNLALMKISQYYKSLGKKTVLLQNYNDLQSYEMIFISKVFSFTNIENEEIIRSLPNVQIGGTGFFASGGKNLPEEIEHKRPDYHLYDGFVFDQIALGKPRQRYADYLDYSIGFTTRGCFRKCPFCVNRKFDHAFKHSPIDEFVDENRPYIYLWDDNFFAYEGWEEILDELNNTKKPFQFRQGLDIRLLDKKKADKVSKSRYKGDYIFAFDSIQQKELIEEKLTLWRNTTNKGTRLYLLCGFESQDEIDIENIFKRIEILLKFDCLPYIMRHEKYLLSPWRTLYVNIARWCNQPQFFKKMSFREFCEANQKYHKNTSTKCAALKSMEDFEAQWPSIAKRYFDMKY